MIGEINTRFGNGVIFSAEAGIDMVCYLVSKDLSFIGKLKEGIYSRYLEEIMIDETKLVHLE